MFKYMSIVLPIILMVFFSIVLSRLGDMTSFKMLGWLLFVMLTLRFSYKIGCHADIIFKSNSRYKKIKNLLKSSVLFIVGANLPFFTFINFFESYILSFGILNIFYLSCICAVGAQAIFFLFEEKKLLDLID